MDIRGLRAGIQPQIMVKWASIPDQRARWCESTDEC